MLIIDQNKLVSLSLIEEHFVCNLEACKGACCWEGDYGAPVNEEEREILEQIYPKIRPLLTVEGALSIALQGTSVWAEEGAEYATPLIDGAACAYLTQDANGIAKCGIEKAYEQGLIEFKKPISCHLYPVRTETMSSGFEALNYHEWDICAAACSNGKSLGVPVYQFVADALIRKYGQDFYDELHAAALHIKNG